MDGARVITKYLNHPALALGYRLEVGSVAVVYSSDHEPHASPLAAPGGAPPAHREDRRHVEFLAGADLVIHDAQYRLDEYHEKIGWGHTPAECAVDYALAARARRLALFHHEPLRDDEGVDGLLETCRQRAAAAGGGLEVFAAAEGQVIELAEGEGARPGAASPTVAAPIAARQETILVADDDPAIVMLLRASLEADGFRVVTAADGLAALRLARAERPALLLLDWQMPGTSGIEVTRALRGDSSPDLRTVPVVLITAQTGAENTAAGFAAGVTDYLTKPFRPAHVRARVRAWLLRQAAGPAET